jgi:hypothetical protein
VSEQRIRELSSLGRRPGFPKRMAVPGTAAILFDRAQVEAYIPTHPRGPGGAH